MEEIGEAKGHRARFVRALVLGQGRGGAMRVGLVFRIEKTGGYQVLAVPASDAADLAGEAEAARRAIHAAQELN